MAQIYNEQRVIGIRVVPDGATMYLGRPVIGIRDASGVLFSNLLRTIGVADLSADQAIYNDQPVVGAVVISDNRVMYNGRLVLPAYAVYGSPFGPAGLFLNGEPGAWYDPSDLSTLYQDAAGTTPVTAAGQVVGLMLDKSGRGNHASQTTAANKPILRESGGLYYLEFDGTDDFLVTPTITPGIDKAQVFAGVRRASTSDGMIVETSLSFFGTQGTLAIVANPNKYEFYTNATAPAGWAGVASAVPATDVISMALDHAGATRADEVKPRINGAIPTLSGGLAGPAGTGNFLAYPLYIGRRGGISYPFNGRLYSLIVRFGSNLDADTIAKTEAWLNQRTGAY